MKATEFIQAYNHYCESIGLPKPFIFYASPGMKTWIESEFFENQPGPLSTPKNWRHLHELPKKQQELPGCIGRTLDTLILARYQ